MIYKFFDDQGNYLAATITYYAFLAIFPILLIATSVLGFVLQGNVELERRAAGLGAQPVPRRRRPSSAGPRACRGAPRRWWSVR